MRVDSVPSVTPDGRSYVVRSARIQDAGRILDHAYLIHRHDPEANVPDPDEFQLSADRLRSTLRSLEKSDNSLFLVACARTEVIATLSVDGGHYRKVRHTGHIGMSVNPKWRRQKVARTLLETAIESARSGGVLRRLTLRVFSTNEAAIRLYESFGFAAEGCGKGQIRIGDRYADDLLMALEL
ncbi:MAG: GNAT family N-acetyltransferase [Planctomycetota bacterium]|jgi:RimJ/RimL family protein N-acetyltransferase